MKKDELLLEIAINVLIFIMVGCGLVAMWFGNDVRAIALFMLALVFIVWGQ